MRETTRTKGQRAAAPLRQERQCCPQAKAIVKVDLRVKRLSGVALIPSSYDHPRMAIVLNVIAAVMLIWLAMRRAPFWISVLLICLVTSPWLFGYLDEVDELDTQPGLLLFGGVVSVAFLSAVAVIARLVRRRIG